MMMICRCYKKIVNLLFFLLLQEKLILKCGKDLLLQTEMSHQRNCWTGLEPTEPLFLLCDEDLLLQTEISSSIILDGQVHNRFSDCFYFATMICCRKQAEVLQGDQWTSQQLWERLFLLCDNDPLVQTDKAPLSKLMDRSTTLEGTVSTLSQ